MTTERYRVLPGSETVRFLDRDGYEPISLPVDGHDAPVADLRPGYLVDADLDWSSEEPRVRSLSVLRPTLYAFVDRIDPVFDAAEEAWRDARATGDSMNSRVTRDTDSVVNGVLYVFGDGEVQSRFEEFRTGARPLEPLLDRVNDRDGPAPREAFVLRPAAGGYVVVTITLEKGGRFADTIRDTYDRPRPTEPLTAADT